jgi:hypothetical protein
MASLLVIVPNWAPLSPDMQAETGSKYASFIPLGGSPLYKHIISQYRREDHRVRIVFVLSPDAPELDADASIDVVRLRDSASIGETILAGFSRIESSDPVIIHMADTLLETEGMPLGDEVYVQSRSDLYRWTSVSIDSTGCIKITNDRQEVEPCGPKLVCVGLFSFSDGMCLAAELSRTLDQGSSRGEPFFVALESYSRLHPMALRNTQRWMDCGHVDGYYESRLSYQNLRHFNSLSYDPMQGRVTKRSSSVEAFRKQVRWFKEVPDEVTSFIPRIFASSDGEDPFITMELLSIPTLGDLFVSQRLNLGAWNDVVRSVYRIQSSFAEKSVRSSLASHLAHAVYFDKTRSRLEEFSAQNPDAERYFILRGAERWSIDRVRRTLTTFIEQAGLLNIEELTPIHGDFCFSNLLYDPKARLIKMIDPRGEFGVPGMFGDRRYDLAKLAHSYAGGYDFIVSDLFSVEVSSQGELHVQLRRNEYCNRVRSIFDEVLLPDLGIRRQVYALQALLFLSMLPLHVDTPARQLAILTIGLELYANSWSMEHE